MEQKDKDRKPYVRRVDTTLSFKQDDPGAEGLMLPKTSRLGVLQKKLSWYSVSQTSDTAGFNFEVFREHLVGTNALNSDDFSFDVVITSGRSIFLISEIGPDDARTKFIRLNKSLFDSCTTLVFESFPDLYLYRINSKELTALETTCGNTAENVKQKFRGSKVIEMAEGFDMEAFIGEISEVSGFFDEHDNFLIAIGAKDAAFSLYVNPNELRRQEKLVCRFTNNGDNFVLTRSELIF
jgi:hypothetical protein